MFGTLDDIFNSGDLDDSARNALGRFTNFSSVAGVIINIIISVGFAIGIIAVSYSAIMYILSAGDPDKTKKAWNAFLYGVVGAAISLGTLVLRTIILRAYGDEVPGITTGLPGF